MLADLDAAVCAGRAAAAASGQSELLDILVGSGARLDDTDAAGDTALIAAAKHGQRACVELLLEGGADVNAPNALGNWTPLHAAAYEQHAAVVMLLMNAVLIRALPMGRVARRQTMPRCLKASGHCLRREVVAA